MKELQKQLIQLMKDADRFMGVHTQVYKYCKEKDLFTSSYLRMVRKGDRDFFDDTANRDKVKKIIAKYKKVLGKYQTV